MPMKNAVIKPVIWNPSVKECHLSFPITNLNSHFIQLNYIPQVGPQCGFAALCMIASFVDIHLYPDELVSKAKVESISNHGEMFSAQNMAQFAKNVLGAYFDITLFSSSKKGSCYQLIEYFKNDCLILIPYDCDSNHEPCLKNGAAAHWAVLCGYVDGNDEENFYVIACHGKSQYAALWKYSKLQASNENLQELGEKRMSDGKQYILPPGGLKQGIASQWILFKKKIR